MTSKQFFNGVLLARERLQMLKDERDAYLSMASGTGGTSDVYVKSTDPHSRTESAAIRLSELTEMLDVQTKECLSVIARAREVIAAIDNPAYQRVLTYRYLLGYRWKDIQDRMDYMDIKSAFRIHGWALQAAQKILDK